MKTCSTCGIEKIPGDFYAGENRCKTCCSLYHKNHYQENAAEHLTRCRNWRGQNREFYKLLGRKCVYKKLYGITLEQYDAMLKAQGGVCAICGSASPQRKNNARLFVDHDHGSGLVRGLLCHKCNQALALLQNSTDLCLNASLYLRSFARQVAA